MSADDRHATTAITRSELARLRGIEEAARWHLSNSSCAGWPQGEVLALALGIDPEAPRRAFGELLDALGIPHDDDPLIALLDEGDENGRSDRGEAEKRAAMASGDCQCPTPNPDCEHPTCPRHSGSTRESDR